MSIIYLGAFIRKPSTTAWLSQDFVVFAVSAVTVEEIDDLRNLFSIDISHLDMLN